MQSDLDLLVERELNGIRLFGFDTYKHENRRRADKLRQERAALEDEAAKRGLIDARTGWLTATGQALDPESDPRVRALAEENAAFQRRKYA